MKKATMQDIADALNISRVTVWKVFSHRDGVSKELQHKIISKALEMNYNVPNDLLTEFSSQSKKEQYTISVTVSRPETSIFWMSIIHKIAKEASNYNINLMYIYLPAEAKEDYMLPAALTNGTVQGMIVLNVYNEILIRKLSKLSMPKIFMDTATQISFRELHGDLLLIEGKSCIMEIVKKLIQHGKSQIGFIGDINYAQTNFERYQGFLYALETHNLPLQSQYCLTTSIGIDAYEESIDSLNTNVDYRTTLIEEFTTSLINYSSDNFKHSHFEEYTETNISTDNKLNFTDLEEVFTDYMLDNTSYYGFELPITDTSSHKLHTGVSLKLQDIITTME